MSGRCENHQLPSFVSVGLCVWPSPNLTLNFASDSSYSSSFVSLPHLVLLFLLGHRLSSQVNHHLGDCSPILVFPRTSAKTSHFWSDEKNPEQGISGFPLSGLPSFREPREKDQRGEKRQRGWDKDCGVWSGTSLGRLGCCFFGRIRIFSHLGLFKVPSFSQAPLFFYLRRVSPLLLFRCLFFHVNLQLNSMNPFLFALTNWCLLVYLYEYIRCCWGNSSCIVQTSPRLSAFWAPSKRWFCDGWWVILFSCFSCISACWRKKFSIGFNI